MLPFAATNTVYTFTAGSSSDSSSPRSSIHADSDVVIPTYEPELIRSTSTSHLLGSVSARSRAPSPALPTYYTPLPSPSLVRSISSSSSSWPSNKEDDLTASDDEDEYGDDEGSSGSVSAESGPSHYAGLVAKLGFKPRSRLIDPPSRPRPKRAGEKKAGRTKAWLRPARRKDGAISLAGDDDGHGPRWLRCLWRHLLTFLRHPWIPATPVTLLFALILFASFAFSLTTFIIHVLDTDKEPLPWRSFCQDQRPFPHELADGLKPVDVFVGVFSVDSAYERRHLIRTTYARHTKPIDPTTGLPASNVQLKFIVGRPRTRHARRVALEMELYGDVVVLDVRENMNSGKTYAYFKWAAENATVPIFYRPRTDSPNALQPVAAGFKRADYIVKADDDTFLMLDELERHLRITPREKTYWGYLIRQLFMGGEVYALSSDLVDYISAYTPLEGHTNGAEDKKVARWMRMHPNASSINWVTERCWIYDHPKAGTTYSHGFLFPDEVERIRNEGRRGLPESERERRGGPIWSQSWSSVTTWRQDYVAPAEGMSMEEEGEALIEGGGRWRSDIGWKAPSHYADAELVHFDWDSQRIVTALNLSTVARPKETWSDDTARSNVRLRYNKFANDLMRDPDDVFLPSQDHADEPRPTSPLPRQAFAQLPVSASLQRLVPLPTLRYDRDAAEILSRRMLQQSWGGTVAVHYLKRNEWFLETALVLLGRSRMWEGGSEPAAVIEARKAGVAISSDNLPQAAPLWNGEQGLELVDPHFGGARAFGSPILVPNGGADVYISEGRPWRPASPPPPSAIGATHDRTESRPMRVPPGLYADPSHLSLPTAGWPSDAGPSENHLSAATTADSSFFSPVSLPASSVEDISDLA